MKVLTRSLVRHAHAIAREVGARVVLLYADVVEEDRDLNDLIQDVDFRVILVSRHAEFRAPKGWDEMCSVVRVPDIMMTRAGQIKVATLVAAAESLVRKGELRTNVLVNGKSIDYLNRHVTSKNESPERIRLAIPEGLLRQGKNQIRIEQVAEANNPTSLDDLGVLGIALETDPAPPPHAPLKDP